MGSFVAGQVVVAVLWGVCLCMRFFRKNCEIFMESSSNPYPGPRSIAETAGDSVESKEIQEDLRAVQIHLDLVEMPVSFKHHWRLECQCQRGVS